MQTETRKQWWQQLAGMSQGMLFLQGHVAHSLDDAAQAQGERRHHVHDAAGKARHQRAVQRLGERRLRAMTSLSLFR
ncbi:hypothetical protein [Pseudoxanthomonas japonensis]|jgi:hypothetical protein|uniref:Uncharacterized protein n=1 Tax=Pseudoxanthomonas japonensis TaxID=69284 RepID=A0ABQ6ZFB4_9GAMM|nr:hypothetical protein [Pseudoxanthomonas japonensis]KAF1724244.1 hypothetical protein CSC78_13110 [Pseudoxanthomonas japonensis]NCT72419.1 hypothetical protein [Xanthomonadaceae bacterium]